MSSCSACCCCCCSNSWRCWCCLASSRMSENCHTLEVMPQKTCRSGLNTSPRLSSYGSKHTLLLCCYSTTLLLMRHSLLGLTHISPNCLLIQNISDSHY
jgi:hypothetical protein